MKKSRIIIFLLAWLMPLNMLAQIDKALILACVNGNSADVAYLLKHNANVRVYDNRGFTPLMYASDNGDIQICGLLLAYGADANAYPIHNDALPPITNSVMQNNPRLLDLMLQFGGNPNLIDSVNLFTPIFYAIKYGYLECVNVLLYHGANPIIECKGKNPLQVAVFYGDTLMAQVLIDQGAQINAKTSDITPLCIAIQQNDYATANWLIKHGADVNLQCLLGTPIFYSAIYADEKMSELLRSNGANINVVNQKHDNLVTLSRISGNYPNKKYFESVGLEDVKKLKLSSVSLSFNNEFCYKEYRIGCKLGVHESRYNLHVYTGLSVRPDHKSFEFLCGEDVYRKLGQQVTMLQFGVEKRFSFRHQQLPDVGALCGYQFSFSREKYTRVITLSQHIIHTPIIGIYQRFASYGFSTNYKYYGYKDMPIHAPKHVAEIAISWYFNANKIVRGCFNGDIEQKGIYDSL